MPRSKAASENVLPSVTACEAESAPEASNRLLIVSVIAQCVAVPVAVTAPSENAATVTLRPVGVRSAGAPIEKDAILFPSVFVDVAAA